MGESSKSDVAVEGPPGNTSLEWVKAVLTKLDQKEEEEEGKCLGGRMGSFESVEAEGRQFGRAVRKRLDGTPRADGVEVPTRVLFDYRRRVEGVVGKSAGEGGLEGKEGEEGRGK